MAQRRPWWARLPASLGVGAGCAVLVAVGLTILDLYQAGHGQPLLSRPWIDLAELGVHLSRADVMFLLSALLGAGVAWRGTGR